MKWLVVSCDAAIYLLLFSTQEVGEILSCSIMFCIWMQKLTCSICYVKLAGKKKHFPAVFKPQSHLFTSCWIFCKYKLLIRHQIVGYIHRNTELNLLVTNISCQSFKEDLFQQRKLSQILLRNRCSVMWCEHSWVVFCESAPSRAINYALTLLPFTPLYFL